MSSAPKRIAEELALLLAKQFPMMSSKQRTAAVQFAELLYTENEIQNLTNIIGAQEFIDGHLIDVLELFKLPKLGKRVADIGSGCGVPGLLAAALDEDGSREWFLIDSESSKAEYLSRSADVLGLDQVLTFAERAETALPDCSPDTVMARAVGPVDKIAGWIWKCSTWNNLVLFKSRGWEAEWERAKTTPIGKKLTVSHTHEYSVGDKYRVIIILSRA